jgi:type I restriction enzyme S subunit
MTGSAGQRRVPEHFLAHLKIPIPSLPEQQRIAEILDKADAVRAKRRAALAQLDAFTQAIFFGMFGHPGTNSKGWPMKHLSDLCLSITDIDHKMPADVEEGIPFISAKDLTDDGYISFRNVKKVSHEDFRRLSRKSKPQKGDIIYSRIGVNLGKARIVEVDFDFIASYSCCTIRANEDVVDSRFLASLLDSPATLQQARRGVRAIAVPDLGLGEIKQFQIVVPPLTLQRRYARTRAKFDELASSFNESRSEFDALFDVLQHRAFRGEL